MFQRPFPGGRDFRGWKPGPSASDAVPPGPWLQGHEASGAGCFRGRSPGAVTSGAGSRGRVPQRPSPQGRGFRGWKSKGRVPQRPSPRGRGFRGWKPTEAGASEAVPPGSWLQGLEASGAGCLRGRFTWGRGFRGWKSRGKGASEAVPLGPCLQGLEASGDGCLRGCPPGTSEFLLSSPGAVTAATTFVELWTSSEREHLIGLLV